MATATFEAKTLSAYCNTCGKFELDTRDIGHFHNTKSVSCLGCTYLAKCPKCDYIVYVGHQLMYIHLSELFVKRSALIEGCIVSSNIKLGEE